MAVPKFYHLKRNNVLILKYSFNSQRLEYYTGIVIDEKYYNKLYWKSGKDPIKAIAPDAVNISRKLKNMSANLLSIESDLEALKVPVTIDLLKKGLDQIYKSGMEPERIALDFMSYYQLVIDERKSGLRLLVNGRNAGKRFKNLAIKNIKSTKSALERYMKYAKIKVLEFSDINRHFYDRFRYYIMVKEEKEISTFGGFIKNIKTIMKEAKDDGLHNSSEYESKYFYMPSYESDTVALTLDQVDKIHALDLSENERMDKIRDLFLIGCYSALRFSDFIDLEIEDIQDNFIRVKQKKTGAYVTIPIMKRLKKVLKKYDNRLPKGCSNQEFNRVIKDVIKKAELTQIINVKTYKGGVEKIEPTPFYDMVSSHTGRRSYATIMFRKGIPTMLIMSATGHKTEKSFLRYIRATNEDKSRMLAETLKKLGL